MKPIPSWVTVIVVLSLTALLAYNIIVVGPAGYPTSVILGGLLGGYAGLNELLNRAWWDGRGGRNNRNGRNGRR